MSEDDVELLKKELDKYVDDVYSGLDLYRVYNLNLCKDLIDFFSRDKKIALKVVIQNEFGLLGNLVYKYTLFGSSEIDKYVAELDRKIVQGFYNKIGENAVDVLGLSNSLEYMLMLIKTNPNIITKAGPFLRRNYKFYIGIGKINTAFLKIADLSYIRNKKEIISIIKEVPRAYIYLLDKYRADKDITQVAIDEDPTLIIYASYDIRDNKEIILKAVSKNGNSLSSASNILKDDEEVVTTAIMNSIYSLGYASERLRDDEQIVLLAIAIDGSAIQYASERIKNEKTIVVKAIKNSPYAFKFIGEELKNDIEIAKLAVTLDKSNIDYIGKNIKRSEVI